MENLYYFLCLAVGAGMGWIARIIYEGRKKEG